MKFKVDIEYDAFQSPQQLKEIKGWAEYARPMLPHWLERLAFQRWDSCEAGSVAAVNISEPYRSACIKIYDCFFSEPRDRQQLAIIHEVIHIYQGALLSFVRDDVFDYVKEHNEPIYAHFSRQFTKENERVTQDLAIMIKRMKE